jgi:ketosteroid isomerase-like protein
MARYGAKIAEALDYYRMVPERFIDAGVDRVLVFSREGGRGKGSGVEVQTHRTAHLWTLKYGKAVRMQSYWERADPSKPSACRSKTFTPTHPDPRSAAG